MAECTTGKYPGLRINSAFRVGLIDAPLKANVRGGMCSTRVSDSPTTSWSRADFETRNRHSFSSESCNRFSISARAVHRIETRHDSVLEKNDVLHHRHSPPLTGNSNSVSKHNKTLSRLKELKVWRQICYENTHFWPARRKYNRYTTVARPGRFIHWFFSKMHIY